MTTSEGQKTHVREGKHESTAESKQVSENRECHGRSCTECESGTLVYESGELVCKECGLVIDGDQIDRGPDWRAFNQNERDEKARAGAPTTETRQSVNWHRRAAFEQVYRCAVSTVPIAAGTDVVLTKIAGTPRKDVYRDHTEEEYMSHEDGMGMRITDENS